jgi:mono/diheme cytochrome c family protein
MPRSRTCFALGFLGLLTAAGGLLFHQPAAAQVQREDLRPGLVGTYRDGVVEIVQLDSAMALTLQAGEAPHPRLAGDQGTIRWEGYLNVFRPSDYKFSALLRGKFRLTVDGKEVLSAEVNGDAAVHEGNVVKLPAGAYPLVAEFTRLPGEARLELFWQAPIFVKEPVAIANLRHWPDKAPKQMATDRLIEKGRFLVEELSCVRCHTPGKDDKLASGLGWRPGPDLSTAGSRYHAGWIHEWLKNPKAVSSTAVMPRLFADDEAGRTELYAATSYLASLSGPLKAADKPANIDNSIKRGQQLFTSTGCIACHPLTPADTAKPDAPLLHHLVAESAPYRVFPLADQGRKTTPDRLAAFLQDPHKTDPSGRMPSLSLDAKDALDIAHFLCFGSSAKGQPELPQAPPIALAVKVFEQLVPGENKRADFMKLSDTNRWQTLGVRVIAARGCYDCHTLGPNGGNSLLLRTSNFSFDGIKQPASRDKGCLAADAKNRGAAPDFGFANEGPTPNENAAAVRQFLANGTKGAGSPSPTHAAKVALQRFNCLACHNRDGEGGLSESLVIQMRKYEKAENAEAILPPTLSGIGHKLRTSWFREVLTKGGKSRPWMSLRMPQFGAAHVGKLPEAIAALEGTTADDAIHAVKLTTDMIQTGRQLIGKDKGYGCVTCHDIAGVPNSGTRGPDLALTTQHVRYEWYRRWLESAQRMDPGTKMPSIILDGRTMLDNVLGGNADAQAQAMWAYMALGPTLPLPEGVAPAKGLILTVKDRPLLLRTFLPDAGTRAVAVGFPIGISTAFDSTQCRLAYGWSGNFLDATPVWANRGGAPAKVLGTKFWTAPPGFPWMMGEVDKVPNFALQAVDPAFGAGLPEGIAFRGDKMLYCDGYGLNDKGVPTFHYRIKTPGQQFVKIGERVWPLRALQALGLERQFTVEAPAKATAALWLNAAIVPQADLKKPPSVDGGDMVIDLKTAAIVSDKRWLVLHQTGDRATVLVVPQMPKGARWHIHRQADAWKVFLMMEPAGATIELRVQVWSVSRWEPGIITELLKAK